MIAHRVARAAALAAAFALLCGVAACEGSKGDGSAEKTGERIDNAVDDLSKDHRDITDGAAENAGEKLDRAAGNSSAPDRN